MSSSFTRSDDESYRDYKVPTGEFRSHGRSQFSMMRQKIASSASFCLIPTYSNSLHQTETSIYHHAMPKVRSIECNTFQLRSQPNPSNPWRAIREVEEIAMPSGKECTVAIKDGHFGIKLFWTDFISKRIHMYACFQFR
jgi:hypothetical protein